VLAFRDDFALTLLAFRKEFVLKLAPRGNRREDITRSLGSSSALTSNMDFVLTCDMDFCDRREAYNGHVVEVPGKEGLSRLGYMEKEGGGGGRGGVTDDDVRTQTAHKPTSPGRKKKERRKDGRKEKERKERGVAGQEGRTIIFLAGMVCCRTTFFFLELPSL
jgi:hypothetical protein